MENHVHHPRSMLGQPKTGWKCECGSNVFLILLCPDCKGEDSHIIGFQCVNCDSIHVTPSAGVMTWEEDEENVH